MNPGQFFLDAGRRVLLPGSLVLVGSFALSGEAAAYEATPLAAGKLRRPLDSRKAQSGLRVMWRNRLLFGFLTPEQPDDYGKSGLLGSKQVDRYRKYGIARPEERGHYGK